MSDSADVVVVGAGTIGGWASYFARSSGAERVVVLEKNVAGYGASSRAAGIVRAQGGSQETARLGRWSIDFYNRQSSVLGTDSGFRELGYLLLAVTKRDVREGHERLRMQRAIGLDVRWLEPQEAVSVSPVLAPEGHRGGTFLPTDGAIDPPRNVRAYSLAMQLVGVDLRERTPCVGFRIERSNGTARVTGVETPGGVIETRRVVLTGGPTLRALARLLGVSVPVGGARHQVAVTEPHAAFARERLPMVFDVRAGLYWRLEEEGLLFGMSNPAEVPGVARSIDWPYLWRMRRRLERLVPATAGLGLRKVWAATIDYTPDHLPILGPALTPSGDAIGGVTIAAPGGHGMMWGPAVARVAADLALEGRTDVVALERLGLDRFDEHGRSRAAADPIALPFPAAAGDEEDLLGADTAGGDL
ncbi:MAG: NAD(P)/FAD-dependent oxidoreductase [Actinomycetota bacterium]